MDDQIFGGTPTEPTDPTTQQNDDGAVMPQEPEYKAEIPAEENIDNVNQQESVPETNQQDTAPEVNQVNDYRYNPQQFNPQNANNMPGEYYNPMQNNAPMQNNQQYGNQPGAYGAAPVYNYNNAPVNNNNMNNMNGFGQQPYNPNGFGQPANNNEQHPYLNDVQPPKKKSTGMKVFIGIIAAIVVLVIVLMIALFTGGDSSYEGGAGEDVSDSSSHSSSQPIDNVGDITISESSNAMGDAVTVANVAKKFNVGILVYSKNQLYTEGSGVILKEDKDGKYTYIVTCAHVVNYSGVALSVLLEDGTEYPADLVGMDSRTDLAVVRVEASGLPLAEVADSDQLVVGQAIYAVGNPGGSEFFGSVTNGIISAIGRPVSSSTGYEMECIQHTSAINPGNSGGALVNGQGQLVGINSMKIASTEYEGMGFAVPSAVMVEVFNSIIENGYVAGRAKLGIQYATPSNYSQTYAMYVKMKGLPTGTIVIAAIGEDSDLADKDVKVGDMIIAVNGKDMTDADMLADMIEDMSAGDTLTLTIVRVDTDNWTQTQTDVVVTLVEDTGASNTQTPESNENSGNPYGDDYQDWYDFFKEYYGY